MIIDSVTDMQIIYVTCPDIEVARLISRDLLEKKLAACTNILPQMESHYVWEGNYQQDNEVVLLIKTVEHNFRAIETRVHALHTAKVPCVISWRVAHGSREYLRWVHDASTATKT